MHLHPVKEVPRDATAWRALHVALDRGSWTRLYYCLCLSYSFVEVTKEQLYDGRKLLATFCEECNYIIRRSFRGTKSVTTVSVIFVHTCSIECCTKTVVGLYLDLRGRSYQKQKIKVKVWCLCTGIAPFLETILLPLGQKPRETPKMTPFRSRLIVGARIP